MRTTNDDDPHIRLRAIAREEDLAADPRWADLAQGILPQEEEAKMRRAAELYELYRPLDAEFLDRTTGKILASLGAGLSMVFYPRGGTPVRHTLTSPVVVGRDTTVDVRINDPSVSRTHARFTPSGDGVIVEDLGSKLGTRLGDRRIKREEVRVGDHLQLGDVVVVVQPAGMQESAELPRPELSSGTKKAERTPSDLEEDEQLRMALEDEIDSAPSCGQSFAVLMVRAASPEPVPASRWKHRILGRARSGRDHVASYSDHTLAVLLGDAGRERALDFAQQITAAGGPGEPPLLAGVAVFPEAAADAERLIAFSRAALRLAGPGHPVELAPMTPWLVLGEPLPTGLREPVGRSRPSHGVLEAAGLLASSRLPALILGERGTGKELVARTIHDRRNRGGPMVVVRCGAICGAAGEDPPAGEPGSLAAVAERAAGGTLFLDEVGNLPRTAQDALLRLLDGGADVRILAASSGDLEEMARSRRFSRDLLLRLGALILTVPRLSDRVEDIEPLAEHFLRRADAAAGRRTSITPAALDRLESYAWRGNVRELENVIEQAAERAVEGRIDEDQLPDRLRLSPDTWEHVERPHPVGVEMVRRALGAAPAARGRAGASRR
jgi:Sigma-54 interaction domain/FHA domain